MDFEGYCLNNGIPNSSYLGIIGRIDVLEVYFERLTSTTYLEIDVEIFVNGNSCKSISSFQSV